MMFSGLVGACLAATAFGNQYNVLFPKYHAPAECTDGCAKWADVAGDGVTGVTKNAVAALFANSTIPADVGSTCAMPGSAPVHGEGRRLLKSGDAEDSWMRSLSQAAAETGSVPICFCKNSKTSSSPEKLIGGVIGYCTPPQSVPEQINLQFASADIVVAAFVTYEKQQLSDPPTAMLGEEGATAKKLTGISHWYVNGDRKYNLNFVSSTAAHSRPDLPVPLWHSG